MDEQYGTYAPPPQVPGQPPQELASVGQPPARRSKTGVIIAVVVGIVLLMCGCMTVGGFLLFSAADTTTTIEPFDSSITDPAKTDRLAEWLAWDPAVTQQLPEAPAADSTIISQGLAILAPGFTGADTGYSAGYVDVAEDWYYGDLYLVRAYHPSSDAVAAGIEFTVQSAEMRADDVPFEVEDGKVVDTIADGTIEMISRGPFGNLDYPITSSDGEALWRTIGDEWPDAVVMRITTETKDQVTVSITKWRLYAIDDYSPRLYASYTLSNGKWALTGWEYEAVVDLPTEPIDDAPVT